MSNDEIMFKIKKTDIQNRIAYAIYGKKQNNTKLFDELKVILKDLQAINDRSEDGK